MSDIGFKPKVAISMEFLERFGQLPPEVRQKAKRFVEKFRENPVSKAINYEKIHSARDSRDPHGSYRRWLPRGGGSPAQRRRPPWYGSISTTGDQLDSQPAVRSEPGGRILPDHPD